MNQAGIGVGVHYPLPVHQLPAFADVSPASGALPVAEAGAAEILSLPIYPGLTREQQEFVVEVLASCL
jgi:dTDP-4-amino-4,6-dideoxygalactose transaminase